jgi:predicted alpha/beta-hydrolase family hydrolase
MSGRSERISIPAPEGDVSGVVTLVDGADAMVVVAHGAGAGMDHPFMVGFCDGLAAEGLSTLRFNFAYMDAGRRLPDRAPKALPVWSAAVDEARRRSDGTPIWAAGKSFGGRMASMAVAEGAMDVAGLIFLGYPLHPAGKPEKLRDEHLYGLTLPMLFLQGTRDTLALPELLESVVGRLPTATLAWQDGADHSFGVKGVKRTPHEIAESLAPPAAAFVRSAG